MAGVSHSISSLSEDLFALMIAQELNDTSLEFIVDKTFTLRKQDDSSIQFRPDLAILKNSKLFNIIDLKMDMGYKRNYHETEAFNKESKKFELLRSGIYKEISYSRDKKRIQVTADKNIKNQIVVISEKNEGKASNRMAIIKKIDALEWVEIYYLSGEVHPNAYNEFSLNKLRVNQSEFNRLGTDIRRSLA